ncbi:MAG TPA: hypothetical protein VK449_03035 [Anaerolineales bacterium]|nr:hypothetical protein [Anaerolineales bacterium]
MPSATAPGAISSGNPAGPTPLPLPPSLPQNHRPFSGRLVIITYDPQQTSASPYIAAIDLAQNTLTPLWVAPQGGWIGDMALSNDGGELALVYSPPTSPLASGYPGIFLLPGRCLNGDCDGVSPAPLVPPVEGESFFAPSWSPDGTWVYFTHVTLSAATNSPEYNIERVPAAGGQPERVVSLATWPQLSPDGRTLAFVAFDFAQNLNDLFLAAPDGTGAFPLLPIGTFQSVDAPVFSPDGQEIYFSATGPGPGQSSSPPPLRLSWLERLMGVQVAFANGAPSDWWRIPTAGGEPTQLTDIGGVGLSGAFSPDGQEFATISYSGAGIMRPDGTDLVWIYGGAAIGSVIWQP